MSEENDDNSSEPEETQEQETNNPVCGECGHELPGEVQFCPACGAQLDKNAY